MTPSKIKNPNQTEIKTRKLEDFKAKQQTRDLPKNSGYLKFLDNANQELKADEERRTVELAFSSETPYERWFGDEILDHSPAAIDLERLRAGGAVLMDHNTTDQIGVVESVRIDSDRVARAVVRFSRSKRGQEIFNDIIDGIRKNISVGYFIKEMILEKQNDDKETYRVTSWEPFEISIVSVPADPTVGVGRSVSEAVSKESPEDTPEDIPTAETDEPEAPLEASQEAEELTPSDGETTVETPSKKSTGNNSNMTDQVTADAISAERARIKELTETGAKFGAEDLAKRCIEDGSNVDTLNALILERKGFEATPAEGTTEIGLTDKEVRSYSMVKVLNALANPNDKRAQKDAAFELEIGAEAARKMQKEAKGIIVPYEVLSRAHSAGVAADGGDLIKTDLLSGSFIDILQNRLAIMGAGATMLSGLEGNIAIPRQTGGAAAFWLAENGEPSETSATFDQIALTPKTVGAYTELSRKLLQQSSIGMEQFVLNELTRVLALEIDRVALNGSGAANQPLGILNVPGIGSVAGGANGAAPIWKHIVDLETEIADANADVGALKYLTNAKVRGKLKQTEITPNSGRFVFDGSSMNGYETLISNQVPKNLTKGTGTDLSAIVFGNFADLIIGMWGGLDLQVNPYSLDKKGAVRVTAFQDVDTVVRHPESFSAMTDAITH